MVIEIDATVDIGSCDEIDDVDEKNPSKGGLGEASFYSGSMIAV